MQSESVRFELNKDCFTVEHANLNLNLIENITQKLEFERTEMFSISVSDNKYQNVNHIINQRYGGTGFNFPLFRVFMAS